MTPADLIARHKGFTPGPWETQESPSGSLLLIRGNHKDRFQRHPQTHLQIVPVEDARLIADAPLMLAALTAQAERIAKFRELMREARDAFDCLPRDTRPEMTSANPPKLRWDLAVRIDAALAAEESGT